MKFDDSIVRGMLSGMGASYVYRTAKVIFFGNGKPDDKHEEKPEDKHEEEKHG